MSRKINIILSALLVSAAFTGCGDKEKGTKYEYADSLIFEQDDTTIKLLNSTETEEELKLNFSFENFETEDVAVTVYDAEENNITEDLECSYDEEKSTVSIKGDISNVETAEVALNYQTSVKLKELKNEEFKYLVTSFEDDHGCTYLGDLEDFKVTDNDEPEDGEDGAGDGSAAAAGDGSGEDGNDKKPSSVRHMKKEEIFELLKGRWSSDSGDFSIEFSDSASSGAYRVKTSGTGADEYDSEVTYFDETKTDDGSHKIRFVTGHDTYGNCRELILSEDGKEMSYISGTEKNENDEFREIYVVCHRK